ncbi:hypothetical protein F4679DRAFT_581242 [Xylaria curta]|nr:hypothetical protein F4679DRAFT_581242 [Xylaria curta]
MAFRKPVGGAALPSTFRCRVCGKNKAPAAFSKNQLQKWYNKKRNDRENKVTPENIGLSCQDHNNEEREIRCHGPCDRIKVVGHFSKNQRNNREPWCILCTEWRLSFDGTEDPNDVPNGPLVRPGDDGISDEEEFELETSAMSSDEDDDDDDDDDINPYSGSKTLVSNLIDRLEGYGDEANGEDTTTDAVSTTNDISLWNEDANSDFGSGKSARTVTGMQPVTTQSGRTLADIIIAYKPGRVASHSQGYTATASNAASAMSNGVGHLTHLAAGLGIDHQTVNTQGSQTSFSQLSTTHPTQSQMSKGEVGQKPFIPLAKTTTPYNSNFRKAGENQRPGTGTGNNKKWYKGDNRKVFPSSKRSFADRPEDGTEAPHDSDSPDEIARGIIDQ